MSAQHSRSTKSGIATEDTRAKLLDAAAGIFAEHGYYGATVRDICSRANVNLALVNYHFGDKLELYTQVFRETVKNPSREVLKVFTEDAAPEELLRRVIHVMFSRILGQRDRGNLHLRLMIHELAQPTPAIGRVVDEVIRPLYERLCKTVGEILELPPKHAKTRMCVHSIIGQILHYAHASPVVSRLWPGLKMTPAQQRNVAQHIADFSLAYLRNAACDSSQLIPNKNSRRRK
jgi:AcrR family transcriptional regulator